MNEVQFNLSEKCRGKNIQQIIYDLEAQNILVFIDRKATIIHVDLKDMNKTRHNCEDKLDGKLDSVTKQEIISIISEGLGPYMTKLSNSGNGEGEEAERDELTKAELVLEVASQQCVKLFVDEYQVPHAAILVADHLETIPLGSRRFRNWIARILYVQNKTVIESNTLKDAIGVLSAQAIFDSGDPIKLNLRVAQDKEPIADDDENATASSVPKSVWFYDLTNKNWELVEITSAGWNIVKSKDLILFRRFSNQMTQVYPSKEYSADIFDKFIRLLLTSNIKDESNRTDYEVLLECYIISLLIPDISKVVLMPHGHQGSAKSTLMESIKMLVDPSVITTLSFPRDKNELIQQMSHNYVTIYDNVSRLPKWISDEICRAVTGSGSSKRVLYTDDDDFIYNLKRCVGINGINLAANSPDLLDRGLNFELKRIEDKDNRKLEDVKREVEKMTPQLLGYILDILVKVLNFKELNPDFKLEKYPRMADFAEYAEIISRCMGNADNSFIEAYWRNIKTQTDQVIDSSQIATCLMSMMFEKYEEKKEWIGTASSLLLELQVVAESLNIDIKNKFFPKNPNVLSRRLNEIVPSLKDVGLGVEFLRNQGPSRVKKINICKVSSTSAVSSQQEIGVQQTLNNLEEH